MSIPHRRIRVNQPWDKFELDILLRRKESGIKIGDIHKKYFPERSLKFVISAYQRAKEKSLGVVTDFELVSTAYKQRGENIFALSFLILL